MDTEAHLPRGVVWEQRLFPDANFLLLEGERPALVDTGFVAHAESTLALAHEHTPRVDLVVNTHWHSDHVGGNALLQSTGAGIVGSHTDARALDHVSPGCCLAEYLDQPVPRYTVDHRVGDRDRLLLGDGEWTVLSVPGHTPGHLALWNGEHRILAAGDTLSTYDVGWVNVVLEGERALDTALDSLAGLRELGARVILPGHGPLIDAPEQALDTAIRRLERQRADLELAVHYGAKRILAFALMIRGGMGAGELDDYLAERSWVRDAARTLETTAEGFTRGLVDSMLTAGALTVHNGVIRAAAPSTPVDPAVFDLPFPHAWAHDRPGHAGA